MTIEETKSETPEPQADAFDKVIADIAADEGNAAALRLVLKNLSPSDPGYLKYEIQLYILSNDPTQPIPHLEDITAIDGAFFALALKHNKAKGFLQLLNHTHHVLTPQTILELIQLGKMDFVSQLLDFYTMPIPLLQTFLDKTLELHATSKRSMLIQKCIEKITNIPNLNNILYVTNSYTTRNIATLFRELIINSKIDLETTHSLLKHYPLPHSDAALMIARSTIEKNYLPILQTCFEKHPDLASLENVEKLMEFSCHFQSSTCLKWLRDTGLMEKLDAKIISKHLGDLMKHLGNESLFKSRFEEKEIIFEKVFSGLNIDWPTVLELALKNNPDASATHLVIKILFNLPEIKQNIDLRNTLLDKLLLLKITDHLFIFKAIQSDLPGFPWEKTVQEKLCKLAKASGNEALSQLLHNLPEEKNEADDEEDVGVSYNTPNQLSDNFYNQWNTLARGRNAEIAHSYDPIKLTKD